MATALEDHEKRFPSTWCQITQTVYMLIRSYIVGCGELLAMKQLSITECIDRRLAKNFMTCMKVDPPTFRAKIC